MLTAPDPTVEGLAKAWTDAPGGLGLFTAEGGAFFGGFGMSADHKLKTAAVLSELWDGAGIRRMRAGDGVSILSGRRLSAHLMAQAEAAEDFLNDPLLKGQGLLSRVLVAAPDSIAGGRFYRDPDPLDDASIRAYGARMLSLLEKPVRTADGSRNELDPEAMSLSPSAANLWREFFDHVEGQCGKGGALAEIRGFAAKAAENAARIAGVLTVIEDGDALEISEGAMMNAVDLTNWHVGEAVRLAEAGSVSPPLRNAQRLLDWMLSQGKHEFAFRDVVRLGPNALRSKAGAEAAFRTLIEHGHVEEIAARPRSFRVISEGTP